MPDLWSWDQTEKRAYASGVLENKELLVWFEGYLRFAKEDTEARMWVQDLIREADYRKRTGDPFGYHPSSADGIDRGDICLGYEVHNGTPYRLQVTRGTLPPERPGH